MATPGCGIELSTRSDGVELPPGGPNPKTFDLLNAEAELDTWRIVELFSRTAQPFDVNLAWSAGSGSGASASLSVATATRVALFARSLRIRCVNRSGTTNRVGVTVADGAAQTENVFETHGITGLVLPWTFRPPSFASRFRVDFANPAATLSGLIRLRDGFGAPLATYTPLEQPSDGIHVGGVGQIEVSSPDPGNARAIFFLHI